MECVRFKYGALFILGDLFETHFSLQEAFWPLPSLEPTCFGGAPLAVGPIPIFFLILPMVPLEVAWLITGEAPLVSPSWAHIARAIFTWRTGSSGMASLQ